MKKIFVLFGLLLGAFMIAGCGNDDDDATKTEVLPDDPDREMPPVVYNPEVMPENGLVVQYCLRNQNGKRTTEFKYGDDIIFDISIANLTDDVVYIQGERDGRPTLFPTPYVKSGIKDGIFNIHTEDGKFVGYPYDPVLTGDQTAELRICIGVWPEEPLRWTATWSGKQYEGFMAGNKFHYYKRGVANKPLNPGKYYTEFEIRLAPNEKKMLRIDFSVVK